MRYLGINLQWKELKKKKLRSGESMAVHWGDRCGAVRLSSPVRGSPNTMSVGAGTPAREELSWTKWCLSSSPSYYWGEGWRRSWGWRWCPGCRWRGRSPRRAPPSHSPALRQHPGSFASGTVLLEANSVPFKRIRWQVNIQICFCKHQEWWCDSSNNLSGILNAVDYLRK